MSERLYPTMHGIDIRIIHPHWVAWRERETRLSAMNDPIEAFGAGFAAGMAEAQKQTPLQAAALAALVAWRKAEMVLDEIGLSEGWEGRQTDVSEAQYELRAAAEALIAEQEATS